MLKEDDSLEAGQKIKNLIATVQYEVSVGSNSWLKSL